MFEDLKAAYEEKRKTYPYLPSMDDLNFEFEISNYVDERKISPMFPMRYTRRCMAHLIASYIGYLHDFILPNPQSAIAMKEYEYFDEKEKEQIIHLIGRLMRISRYNSSLELMRNEKEDAKFILEMFNEWKRFKDEIAPFMHKNVESWNKQVKEFQKEICQ